MSGLAKYIALPLPTDLSNAALEEAAMRLPPARKYTLYVEPKLWTCGLGVVRHIASQVKNNPFAPFIDLVTSGSLGRYEWYLTDGDGHAVGSQGPL